MSSNRRGTCPVCGRKDQFLFAKGKCRTCYFTGEGRQFPGCGKSADKALRAEEDKQLPGEDYANVVTSLPDKSGLSEEVTLENVLPGKNDDTCNCEVGMMSVAGVVVKRVFKDDFFFHDGPVKESVELNNFCPRCGKRLKLKLETVPVRFKTVVSIEA